jgi:hypothetical protein
MVLFGFSNYVGLLALLSIIPLVIFYFIRPRPKEVEIPSLMFLEKGKDFRSKSSFFRRLFNDNLLLFQIILLALLALFFSAPFLLLEGTRDGNVISVLDLSSSMGVGSIFEESKGFVEGFLGERNTLVIVGNNPSIIIEEGDVRNTKKLLDELDVGGSRSSIGESISAARESAQKINGEKLIVIASDFMETEDGNVKKEIDLIKQAGIPLKVLDVGEEGLENVGIVSLVLGKENSEVVIENFCCGEKDVVIEYGGERSNVKISNRGSHNYQFKTVEGNSELRVNVEDAISNDNVVYISNPEVEKIKVLLITKEESKYLSAALKASGDFEVDIVSPNKARKKGFDVYVLHGIEDVSKSLISFLEEELDLGKGVIVHVEKGISGDYGGLLDFKILKEKKGDESVIEKSGSFVEGLSFGRIGSVREIKCGGECGGVYVSSSDEPVIMLNPKGNGLLGYYGVDGEGGFKTSPEYPIFWTRFVKHIGGFEDIRGVNLRAGSMISFGDEMGYKKPSGKVGRDNIVVLDEVGFYEIGGRVYSANLLSSEESGLVKNEEINDVLEEFKEERKSGLVKRNIWRDILFICMLFVLIEWIWSNKRMKRRKYYA